MSSNFCFGWHFCGFFQLGNKRADSAAVELPTVIWAHDVIALYADSTQSCSAMDANVARGVRDAFAVSPNHKVFAKQFHRQWSRIEILGKGNRVKGFAHNTRVVLL